MFNLLSNAAKHSPENGRIRLGASRVGGKIRLWVKDQGPGIAPEAAKGIFDKFTTASAPESKGIKGSGLGLHISRQIVEQMGGRIGLDSMQGAGSTFWIDLPERQPAPMAASAEEAAKKPGKRILICEDDDTLACVIQLMLAKAGYTADIVHSVPEARRRLMSGAHDAVTLDLTLPLGDGLDFAR